MNSLIVSQCYKNAAKKSDNPTEKNFTAECNFCPKRVISGNINNSSNFLKHIQEQHPRRFKEFESVKSQVGSRKRKIEQLEQADSVPKKLLCQPRLHLHSATSVVSQSTFDSALCSMITSDMQPLAMVSRKGFAAFCEKVAPQCVLMSRRTLGRRISQLYTEEKNNLISELQNAEWLSATADAWSSHKRAFMGVTVHYVEPVTFEMRSTVLGVRCFKHAHSGEAVAKMLLSMLNEYGIRSKVQNIVTDNAANFGKAFKIAVDATEVCEVAEESRPVSYADLDDVDECDILTAAVMTDDEDGAHDIINVYELLTAAAEADDADDDVEVLPPHKLCGNHTLNLVASSDSLTARTDRSYKRATTFAVFNDIEIECEPQVAATAPTPRRLFVSKRAMQAYGHLSSAQEAAIRGSIFTKIFLFCSLLVSFRPI